jgi:phosphoglycolate phosphatase-like HAD superfamily hydrolase
MLQRAAERHRLDLGRSVMIGDSFRDVGAGRAAGTLATVLLRTGYGHGELLWKSGSTGVWPDRVADTLEQAVDWALQCIARPR